MNPHARPLVGRSVMAFFSGLAGYQDVESSKASIGALAIIMPLLRVEVKNVVVLGGGGC